MVEGVALILVAVEENFDMFVVLCRSLDAVPEDNVVVVAVVVVVEEEVDVCTGVDDKERPDKHHIDVGLDVVQQPFAVVIVAAFAAVVAVAKAVVHKDSQHWEDFVVAEKEAEAQVGDGKQAAAVVVVAAAAAAAGEETL